MYFTKERKNHSFACLCIIYVRLVVKYLLLLFLVVVRVSMATRLPQQQQYYHWLNNVMRWTKKKKTTKRYGRGSVLFWILFFATTNSNYHHGRMNVFLSQKKKQQQQKNTCRFAETMFCCDLFHSKMGRKKQKQKQACGTWSSSFFLQDPFFSHFDWIFSTGRFFLFREWCCWCWCWFFRHFTSSVCMLCSNVRMYVCFFGWASFSLLIMFVKKRLNWNKIQTNNNNKVHCVCFFLSEWIIFRYLFQQQQ